MFYAEAVLMTTNIHISVEGNIIEIALGGHLINNLVAMVNEYQSKWLIVPIDTSDVARRRDLFGVLAKVRDWREIMTADKADTAGAEAKADISADAKAGITGSTFDSLYSVAPHRGLPKDANQDFVDQCRNTLGHSRTWMTLDEADPKTNSKLAECFNTVFAFGSARPDEWLNFIAALRAFQKHHDFLQIRILMYFVS